MLKKVLAAMAVPVLGLAIAGAAATAAPENDGCCCVVNDAGQLVCTVTGAVLETCCCE